MAGSVLPMNAIFGATAALTAKTGPLPLSGGFIAAHGVANGAGMICLSGAGLMQGIAVRDAVNGQRVRGGCGEANFPIDFGKILR